MPKTSTNQQQPTLTSPSFQTSNGQAFAESIRHLVLDTASAENSANIKRNLARKAQEGGTTGRAPLGYLNGVVWQDGRRENTVVLDEERAPHLAWAFRVFCTGAWSLTALRDELRERGLRAMPTRKTQAHPLTTSDLKRILSNPYYKGSVRHDGQTYPGQHPALIGKSTWQRANEQLTKEGTHA